MTECINVCCGTPPGVCWMCDQTISRTSRPNTMAATLTLIHTPLDEERTSAPSQPPNRLAPGSGWSTCSCHGVPNRAPAHSPTPFPSTNPRPQSNVRTAGAGQRISPSMDAVVRHCCRSRRHYPVTSNHEVPGTGVWWSSSRVAISTTLPSSVPAFVAITIPSWLTTLVGRGRSSNVF